MEATFEIDNTSISIDEFQQVDQDPTPWYDTTALSVELVATLAYVIELISSIVLVAFVIFETSGLAGPYRTIINQLLSYLYSLVSIEILNFHNSSFFAD